MKPKLYLETTIPSYLTARPTRDPLMSGQISETKKWWRLRRNDFELFISPIVLLEANRGDVSASRRRMQVLAGLPELPISPEVEELLPAIERLCSGLGYACPVVCTPLEIMGTSEA